MVKEEKTQAKIGVEADALWKALANKHLKLLIPKVIPNLVKHAQVIEGDGGLGTIYLFNFGPDVKAITYQKEKISELDESLHRIAFEVIEGGHLDLGFSFYTTIFQLTDNGEGETLVDVTVEYETAIEESDAFASNTISSSLAFIKILEKYLTNGDNYFKSIVNFL